MKTTFIVMNMECPTCTKFLESLPLRLAGVNKTTANLKKRTLKVDYDETRLNPERILAVVSSFGYHPVLKDEEENLGNKS